MDYDLTSSREILSRTPVVIAALVRDLPAGWTRENEGPDTWSVFDVVGHLIDGERENWIPRARMILERGTDQAFEPFDRFAHLDTNKERSLGDLLAGFAEARAQSLAALDALRIRPEDLAREGRHPDLGMVTLGQLLSTWVVHDFDHLSQITRVMAKQYATAIGPWKAYLRIVRG